MSATRQVPTALRAYMQGRGLHMAYATRVGPLPDGSYRHLVSTTQNQMFDHGDGFGPQLHYGRGGVSLSQLVSTAGLGVDNAEATTLAVDGGVAITGFTQAQVIAGELDAVPYVTRCFCYVDTSLGSFVWASGTIGQVRKERASLINFELTSLSMQLRQVIGQVDSTRCRAIFGSQPIGSSNSSGAVTEMFPCTFDTSSLWVDFELTAVSPDDADLLFYSNDLSGHATDAFAYGMVRCLTGHNAGLEREVDTFTNDGIQPEVRLAFPWPYNPEVGDQFQIRRGCSHTPSGCASFFGSSWVLHYRGEPRMPIGDAAGNLVSGAGIPGDIGGTGEPPIPSTPPAVPPSGGSGSPSSVTAPARTRGATIRNVMDYGAVRDGVTDDTGAFNSAFNSLPGDGGLVYAPGPGTYLIDPDVMIKPVSYSALELDVDAHLQLSYTSVDHRYGIYINGKTNVEIFGGMLTGYKDAWSPISGTTSEWGHGIAILNGSNAVTVRDITIQKCVGDGISIGHTCSDVYIDNILSTENRRQGVSVGGDNWTIANSEISYISGTSPEGGIDVEADSPGAADNGTIHNCHIHHCDGPAVICWQRSTNIDITDNILEFSSYGVLANDSDAGNITGNTIRHNRNKAIRFQAGSSGYSVNSNILWNNDTNTEGFMSFDASKLYSRNGVVPPYTTHHITVDSGATANVTANEVGPWPE